MIVILELLLIVAGCLLVSGAIISILQFIMVMWDQRRGSE